MNEIKFVLNISISFVCCTSSHGSYTALDAERGHCTYLEVANLVMDDAFLVLSAGQLLRTIKTVTSHKSIGL
jgi:hypothetical protein